QGPGVLPGLCGGGGQPLPEKGTGDSTCGPTQQGHCQFPEPNIQPGTGTAAFPEQIFLGDHRATIVRGSQQTAAMDHPFPDLWNLVDGPDRLFVLQERQTTETGQQPPCPEIPQVPDEPPFYFQCPELGEPLYRQER